MEQWKAMEYKSRKASSDVLKPRNIYIYNYSSNNIENVYGGVLQILIALGGTSKT